MELRKEKVNSKFIDLQEKAKDQKARKVQSRPLLKRNVEARIGLNLSIDDIPSDDELPF